MMTSWKGCSQHCSKGFEVMPLGQFKRTGCYLGYHLDCRARVPRKMAPPGQHDIPSSLQRTYSSATLPVPVRPCVGTEQKVGPDHMLCYVETAFMVGSVIGTVTMKFGLLYSMKFGLPYSTFRVKSPLLFWVHCSGSYSCLQVRSCC